ncbi:serine hydrolase [Spirosoma sp. BT702]|uniref:Serine hydrolase n=1 Tax=Spirosoma profusum TaxID=2771354 RepID=A0A927AQY4_9BACT|nr:serine hydrolase domain-containing protein [Spirosoma profusum]MBD2701458.1 serine hydrolase [Spirosoma profusum]
MKRSLNFLTGLALTSTLLTLSSCDKLEEPQPVAPTGAARSGDFGLSNGGFDASLMKTKIEAYLDGRNLAGYAYSIYVDGHRVTSAEGGGGFARKAVDAPKYDHASIVRQELASCSKYITTLATLRMIERADLPYTELIWKYLPSYMNVSEGVRKITFGQLLSHHSGLVGGIGDLSLSLSDMEKSVETDNSAMYDQYQYNNMNFALCRVLIPYMYWKKVIKVNDLFFTALEIDKSTLDDQLAKTFLDLVREDVFKPAGLPAWQFLGATDPSIAYPPLYYSNNNPNSGGVAISGLDNIKHLGAGGFNLNAWELAQIVSAARYNKIVYSTSMNIMRNGYKDHPIGFMGIKYGKYGQYFYHFGDATWNTNNKSGGLASVLVDFKCTGANVQVVVVTNQNDGGVSEIEWLKNAFDTSWN